MWAGDGGSHHLGVHDHPTVWRVGTTRASTIPPCTHWICNTTRLAMLVLWRSARACGAFSIIFPNSFDNIFVCLFPRYVRNVVVTGTLARRCCAFSRMLTQHILFDNIYVCVSVCLSDSANTTLKRLNLRGNRVGDAGAEALAGALRVRQPSRSSLHVGDGGRMASRRWC